MKLLLRASCGHEAVFDPPGADNWTEENKRDFIFMVQDSGLCNDCGAKQEAEYMQMFKEFTEEHAK